MNLQLTPKHILFALLIIIGALLVANLIGIWIVHFTRHDYAFGLITLFNFNAERSVPAFYSASALFASACLLALVGGRERQLGHPSLVWFGLAVVFAFLSLDEIAALHERLNVPVREYLSVSGIFHFAWVIPYGVAVLLLAAIYFPFLLRLPRRSAWLFVAAGTLFVVGAIGVELFGGQHSEIHGRGTLTYALLYTLEELLEKLGVAVFIYALCDYIVRQYGAVRIAISCESSPVQSVAHALNAR